MDTDLDKANDVLLWDLDETARQLGGISIRTLRRMIDAGEFPYVSVRRSIKIPAISVQKWVDQNMSKAHNLICAGPSVQKEKSTCQKSAKTGTRMVSINERIRNSGGLVSPTQAAKELGAVLELRAAKKPR